MIACIISWYYKPYQVETTNGLSVDMRYSNIPEKNGVSTKEQNGFQYRIFPQLETAYNIDTCQASLKKLSYSVIYNGICSSKCHSILKFRLLASQPPT